MKKEVLGGRDHMTSGSTLRSRGLLTAHDLFSSTSFQKIATGFSLIVASVLMERRISASRSGLKSQRSWTRGNSFNGDRSDTFVPWQSRNVSFMSLTGDR